jgi:hypothetical protein
MLFNPDMNKQAVEVIFSKKRNPGTHPDLVFNSIPVKRENSTLHLGLILDGKLNFEEHLEAKFAKVNSGLGLMKYIKKWVDRRTLEQIYKLYTRPHLDYGDIIYNISELDKNEIFPKIVHNEMADRIESKQYQAARIVTGAWKGTKRDKLYDDLGWESLSDRRTCRKLALLFEIQEENFPRYLSAVVDEQKYDANSRFYNKDLLKSFVCRTNAYKLSFFPSTIEDWNRLDSATKQSVSVKSFKNKIFNKIRPKKKSYFGIPDDDAKLITLLRMGLSPLRAHKFKYKFKDTSNNKCLVCGSKEDTAHYLIHCLSYRLTRVTLFRKVNNILNIDLSRMTYKATKKILLYGKEDVEDEINKRILQEVSVFIKKSKRLDTW